jgi:hypothetical protein
VQRLRAFGIETYYTKCLTLAFPRRIAPPRQGKVFLVDVDRKYLYLPKKLRANAMRISHLVCSGYDDEFKRMIAKKTLDLYRDHARLVITTRLHCALPCAAMGIPVVFLSNKPRDIRLSILKDIGIRIHRYRKFRSPLIRSFYRLYFKIFRAPRIDWNPAPLELEAEKERIVSALRKVLKEKGVA